MKSFNRGGVFFACGLFLWVAMACVYCDSPRDPKTYLPAMSFSVAAWLLGAGTGALLSEASKHNGDGRDSVPVR